MALGSAWTVGLSGLATAADQIALSSRNVARAGDSNANRKVAEQVTLLGGGVRIATVDRVADRVLLEASVQAASDVSRESAISAALRELHSASSDPELERSPAALIGKLESQLRLFGNDPSSLTAGRQVIAAAADLAGSLNEAAQTVASVRNNADQGISQSVEVLREQLARLELVNNEIVRETGSNADITDKLDERDTILKAISQEVGIRVVPRNGNDIIVYTDGGVTLFDRVPRQISFTSSVPLGAGASGANVVIDGVEVTGSNAVMPLRSGAIAGMLEVRDNISVNYQAQLDEVARGLIAAFADRDRTGGGKPDLPGLFTWSVGTVPAAGAVVDGLASLIRVNAAVDPDQGGNLTYLRDGGAMAPADPDYNANVSGYVGFSGRISELVTALGSTQSFDATAGLKAQDSVKNFASESVGWLDQLRKDTSARLEVRTVVRDRSLENLLSATGVNLDKEMADLLRYERSYQASSRLVVTVDELIKTLIAATR